MIQTRRRAWPIVQVFALAAILALIPQAHADEPPGSEPVPPIPPGGEVAPDGAVEPAGGAASSDGTLGGGVAPEPSAHDTATARAVEEALRRAATRNAASKARDGDPVVGSGDIPGAGGERAESDKDWAGRERRDTSTQRATDDEAGTSGEPYIAIIPAMGRWVEKETICPGCAYTKKIPICDTIDIPVYRIIQVPRYRTVRTPKYEWRTVPTYRTCEVPTYKEVDVAIYDYREVPVKRTRKVYKYEDVEFPVLKTERTPATREVWEPQYEEGEVPNYVTVKVPKREIIKDCVTGDEVCRVCGHEEKEVLQGTKRFKTLTGHKRTKKKMGVRLRWKQEGTRKVRRVTGIKIEQLPDGTKREKYQVGTRKDVRIVGYTTQKVPSGTCRKRVKVGESVSRVYAGVRYIKQRIGTRTVQHANGYRTKDILVKPGSRITERDYVRTPRRMVTVIPDAMENTSEDRQPGPLPTTTEVMTESEYHAALFGQRASERATNTR